MQATRTLVTAFALLLQYDFEDPILSSGQPTGWEVQGRGLNTTFLFEYMAAKGITVGGIFQSGRAYVFAGSRIDAYRGAGYVIKAVVTETVGFRVGYGF